MALMNLASAIMGGGLGSSQNGTARPAPRLPVTGKTAGGQPIYGQPQRQTAQPVNFAGGLGQMLGGMARGAGPAMTGMVNSAGAAAGQAVANPNRLGNMLTNQGPNNMPRQQQGQKPQQPVYGANIMPMAQAGINQQQTLQNAAAYNVANAGNQAQVGGPLQGVYSNPVAPGSAQGAANSPAQAAALGQWQANYNAAPKAQQTIGAMGDPGDARWNAQMAPGSTYTDQGQVLGGGGAGGAGGAAGGSGAGGAGGAATPIDSMVQDLINEYQSAHDARNADADASRLAGAKNFEDQRKRAMNEVNRLGQGQAQEIRDQTRQAKGTLAQSMAGRGLSNTSSNPVLQNAIDKNSRKSMVGLGDNLARQRLDVDQQTTGNINQWMLANAPEGPQMGELAQLLQGLGASGYGQPMGSAGDFNVPDLSGLLNQLFGGNPYAQNLGSPFPQGAQGGGGQQGQRGPVGQQQGQRDFQQNGPQMNASGPQMTLSQASQYMNPFLQQVGQYGSAAYNNMPNAGQLGGYAQAIGGYGSQFPQGIAGAGANLMQGNWGDLGSSIVQGTRGIGNWLGGMLGARPYTYSDASNFNGRPIYTSDDDGLNQSLLPWVTDSMYRW